MHAFPSLNIAMSEGGVGWVNMLADRVDYVLDHSASGTESGGWKDTLKPSEVLAATSGSAPSMTPALSTA
jgi:hypothetical protein